MTEINLYLLNSPIHHPNHPNHYSDYPILLPLFPLFNHPNPLSLSPHFTPCPLRFSFNLLLLVHHFSIKPQHHSTFVIHPFV